MQCLIVGTGLIAEEYIKILLALDCKLEVVGNTDRKSEYIENKYQVKCHCGGLENFNFENNSYQDIIIATPIELLFNHLNICIGRCQGLKNILVEKPGCLYTYQLEKILSIKGDINIFIAYNRRFYNSTLQGIEIIKKDPIKKILLTIDEYNLDKISKLQTDKIMQNYFTNMTTHVVDMTLYMSGTPGAILNNTIEGYGLLPFHKRGCIFKGICMTTNDIPIEYNGDWSRNGKWKIEIMLESGKILSYQPLEDLKVLEKGNDVKIVKRDKLDIDFKPGYYRQINSYISDKKNLLDLETHYKNLKIYHKMVGYTQQYNILLVGCGNIGFRHLQAFVNTKLPLNLTIIEINEENISKANEYIKQQDNINNINFFKDINDIKTAYFDICTVSTCSDIRLKLFRNIVNNNNIEYISNIILEKVVFQNMDQFEEYEEIIKKFKNCNTYISSHWNHIYQNKYLELFKNPKISITGGRWGLMCNSIHALIFISYFKSDFTLNLNPDYQILTSKRSNFKELYGELYNDDIRIVCLDNDNNMVITFIEGKYKLIVNINKTANFHFYENDILIEEFDKNIVYTSDYFKSEYENILLHHNTNICDYNRGKLMHKVLFDAIKDVFNSKLIPIT